MYITISFVTKISGQGLLGYATGKYTKMSNIIFLVLFGEMEREIERG